MPKALTLFGPPFVLIRMNYTRRNTNKSRIINIKFKMTEKDPLQQKTDKLKEFEALETSGLLHYQNSLLLDKIRENPESTLLECEKMVEDYLERVGC